jgi:hypothetical protein
VRSDEFIITFAYSALHLMKNDSLHDLLQTWTPSSEVPPGLRAEVWRRIEATRQESPWWDAWWTLPRLALVATFVIAIAGVGGALRGQQAAQSELKQLEVRYIASVDPLARHL